MQGVSFIQGLCTPHWRRKWQPTPVFLPGESQGQRSLWGHTESDTTERLTHTPQHERTGLQSAVCILLVIELRSAYRLILPGAIIYLG